MRFPLVTHKIIPATLEHVDLIAPMVRHADIEEIWAASMQTPKQAMLHGMKFSSESYVGFVNDEPICMWGIAQESLVGNLGVPWMISTTSMDKYAVTFLRHCRDQVLEVLKSYAWLVNYVDARNIRAMRWLEWLGFEIDAEPQPYGAFSMPFYKFRMWRT